MSETTVNPISIMQDDDKILILFEGMKPLEFKRPKTDDKDDPKLVAYKQVETLVNAEKWDDLLNVIRPTQNLGDLLKDDMAVEGLVMEKGRIKFQGFVVRNSLTDTITKMTAETIRAQETLTGNKKLKRLVEFLAAVIQNSRKHVLDELYDFVEATNTMLKGGKMINLYVVIDKDGKHNGQNLGAGAGWEMPENMITPSTEVVVGTYKRVASHKPGEGCSVVRVVIEPKDVVEVRNGKLVVSRIADVGGTLSSDTWED